MPATQCVIIPRIKCCRYCLDTARPPCSITQQPGTALALFFTRESLAPISRLPVLCLRPPQLHTSVTTSSSPSLYLFPSCTCHTHLQLRAHGIPHVGGDPVLCILCARQLGSLLQVVPLGPVGGLQGKGPVVVGWSSAALTVAKVGWCGHPCSEAALQAVSAV